MQTTRGINGGPDHFGIRTVRGTRFRYIRNFTLEATFQNAATKDPTFKTWRKTAAAGDSHARWLVHDFQHRPAEELYDCETDPWNRQNLTHDPKLAGKIAELRTKLDAWMKQQGDAGQPTEMKALERVPRNRAAKNGSATE
jgi:N-sulfoglucosamine sulfohydrolase